MRKEFTMNLAIGGVNVTASTGKLAGLATGSILLTMGGTVVLATATVSNVDTDLDYFPLSVEYIEKMYARGALMGGRFEKREGRPSEEAVIKAREVDHSIRSLFPKSWKKPVSVVLTVLAYDGINSPQSLTILGASLSLLQSGIPFYGPASSVILALDKFGKIILNPSAEIEESSFEAVFIVSGVDGKLLSLEGFGKEVENSKLAEMLDFADVEIRKMNLFQREFMSQIETTLTIDKSLYPNIPTKQEVLDFVQNSAYGKLKEAMFGGKSERGLKIDEIKKELIEISSKLETPFSNSEVKEATDYICRKILRKAVMEESKRVSGRKLDEIRNLEAEIDILPTVHSSALFSRGETQCLSIATLGPISLKLHIDDMQGETEKTFMHHYIFPPFSTGEVGRYSYYPGRREIGHGAIGENALKFMIPSVTEFPYTIRVASEVLSSNGSTSMAATCAASMALMCAGVPLKEQVAGIGVGLITDEEEKEYKLLMDIEGIEDFYGDMDFKVCGTRNGITAVQYENKLMGVPYAIIKEALEMSFQARLKVLEKMNSIISTSREELPKNAPRVETVTIPTDKIGELIGPGGKHIQGLIEDASNLSDKKIKPDILIEEDGRVIITTSSAEQLQYIKNKIENMFRKPEVGEIYEGRVDKIVEFGAFINFDSPQFSGLLHVSNMSNSFVKDPKTIVQEGQVIKVKVAGFDKGKYSLTLKGI